MIFEGMTVATLKQLHDGYSRAYESDRSLSEREKILAETYGEYFGVDEFPDWNDHVRRLEAELGKHGAGYTPIELR